MHSEDPQAARSQDFDGGRDTSRGTPYGGMYNGISQNGSVGEIGRSGGYVDEPGSAGYPGPSQRLPSEFTSDPFASNYTGVGFNNALMVSAGASYHERSSTDLLSGYPSTITLSTSIRSDPPRLTLHTDIIIILPMVIICPSTLLHPTSIHQLQCSDDPMDQQLVYDSS